MSYCKFYEVSQAPFYCYRATRLNTKGNSACIMGIHVQSCPDEFHTYICELNYSHMHLKLFLHQDAVLLYLFEISGTRAAQMTANYHYTIQHKVAALALPLWH